MTNGVAVVGCGYWGRNLVRNFAELGRLAAVVDLDRNVSEALSVRYGVPARSFDEVLADGAVEGIATASPAHLHRDIAIKAFEAGKHVFVEKPIALSLKDGRAMQSAAERAGRILMVGHLLQYHQAYIRLREMVCEGAIGKLRYCYSNRLSIGKLRTEEDVVWSFAPHDLSMVLGLTGEPPVRVSAEGANVVSGPGVNIELADAAHLHLSFAAGVRAHIFVSWISPFKEQRFVAIGETGSLVFDDVKPWDQKLTLTSHRVEDGPALKKGETIAIKVDQSEPLTEECRHFLGAMAGEHPVRTNADEALAILDILIKAGEYTAKER